MREINSSMLTPGFTKMSNILNMMQQQTEAENNYMHGCQKGQSDPGQGDKELEKLCELGGH